MATTKFKGTVARHLVNKHPQMCTEEEIKRVKKPQFFICDRCDFTCTKRAPLRKHQRLDHDMGIDLKCAFCEDFTTKIVLE